VLQLATGYIHVMMATPLMCMNAWLNSHPLKFKSCVLMNSFCVNLKVCDEDASLTWHICWAYACSVKKHNIFKAGSVSIIRLDYKACLVWTSRCWWALCLDTGNSYVHQIDGRYKEVRSLLLWSSLFCWLKSALRCSVWTQLRTDYPKCERFLK
jgi:hypothetical protein